jgi:hypothetical protein
MDLKKLRDWFVEAKLYVVRTASYLTIFNFLMIGLVFLNTTVWEYAFFQTIFPNRKMFLLVGFISIIFVTFLIGYFDTKFKIWRTESEKSYTAERNPLMVLIAFQCAKMLNELKEKGKDVKEVEDSLTEIFKRCKLSKEFELFKKNTN